MSLQKRTVARKIALWATCIFTMVNSPLMAQNHPSCSDVDMHLKKIQDEKYNLKVSDDANAKSLFELQQEYNRLLGEASIIKELNTLNQEFLRIATDSDPVEEIGTQIEAITNPDNLKALRRMAVMDDLIDNLASKTGLNFAENHQNITVDSILQACQANPTAGEAVLCRHLTAYPDEAGPLVSSFLDALKSSTNDETSDGRQSAVEAYRAVLLNNINPETDFGAIFESADGLASALERSSTQPIEIASTQEGVDSTQNQTNEHEIIHLKSNQVGQVSQEAQVLGRNFTNILKSRCCTQFTSEQDASRDRMCKRLMDDGEFNFNQCRDTTTVNPTSQNVNQSYNQIVQYYNEFHHKLSGMSFKINGLNRLVGIEGSNNSILRVPTRTAFGRFFASIGLVSDDRELQDEHSQKLADNASAMTNRRVQIESTTERIIESFKQSRVQQRLRENARNQARTTSNSDLSSLESIIQDQVATAGANGVRANQNDYVDLANLINQKLCHLETRKNNGVAQEGCRAGDSDVEGYTPPFVDAHRASGDLTTKIRVLNSNRLASILDSTNSGVIAEELANVNSRLGEIRAQIEQIGNSNKYQHLDQIASFYMWDRSFRCSDPVENRITASGCGVAQNEERLDFLVDATGKILAEMDPSNVARRDLANANLSQRRIILGHMNGACQGLANEPNVGPMGITQACGRISSMLSQSTQATDSERLMQLEESGGYVDERGRVRRRNSTMKDVSIGAVRGLPGAVNTMATPFFSGLALRNSLPGQEAYWKQVKFNNYANNWWRENNPMFGIPSMPFMGYTPFYGLPGSPVTTGFNFNQNGLPPGP